jgi:undecaprenyl-diphosphatase
VPIVVTLHLGTAIALLTFYWHDWVALVRAFFKTAIAGRLDADPQGRTIWLLIVGTIPVGLLGLFLQDPIKNLFKAPYPVIPALFLAVNGVILLVAEYLRKRAEPRALDRAKQEQAFGRFENLSFKQAFFIGLSQSLALIPGISRSGVTMAAGLGARLSHEEALRFAFLLATPVIGLAALLEIPQLAGASASYIVAAAVGGVVAAIAAYLSVVFLTRYFQTGRLTPFAYYCLGAGLISFFFFAPLALGWFTLPWAGH